MGSGRTSQPPRGVGWWSVVALAVAAAGCKNDQTTMRCTRVASAEQLCMGPGCDLTWAEVEGDQRFCTSCGATTCSVGSCGPYQIVGCFGVDYGGQSYFDATSGALVASAGFSNGVWECREVGSVSIDLPADASCLVGVRGQPPPAWCAPDPCADGGTP